MARRTLFGFIVTFVLSRVLVFLIMSGRIPNMFLFLHGTHVHHLNYGIFLLAGVAAWSIFRRPEHREAGAVALVYGVALALTFDEFGMWLHLGGSYWQRVSVDAVLLVAALIGLIAYARSLRRLESRHWWAFVAVVASIALFVTAVVTTGGYIGGVVGPALRELELQSTP